MKKNLLTEIVAGYTLELSHIECEVVKLEKEEFEELPNLSPRPSIEDSDYLQKMSKEASRALDN